MSDNQKHIVLDIDDTLIHAFFLTKEQHDYYRSNPEYSYLENRGVYINIIDIDNNDIRGTGIITTIYILFRPYAKEFLSFCLEYFEQISIWSAGHFRYVRAIEAVLFPPNNEIYREKLDKVLTRVDCNSITEYEILKDLASKGFKLENTLIVDDNDTTFTRNLSNAIHIPKYDPTLKKEHVLYDDQCLLKLIKWIKNNSVNTCPDVRLINKSGIFK